MTQEQAALAAAARQMFFEQHQVMEQVVATQLDIVTQMTIHLIACYRAGRKVVWCGNGGSAADAQHLAAELVGRYLFDRPPLPSLALHTDTSIITAIANDYSYEQIFARQIQVHAQAGDIVICLSTSGCSPNILAAARQARSQGATIFGLLGNNGGTLRTACDYSVIIPGGRSYLTQQTTMIIGHFFCAAIERAMFEPTQ